MVHSKYRLAAHRRQTPEAESPTDPLTLSLSRASPLTAPRLLPVYTYTWLLLGLLLTELLNVPTELLLYARLLH